MGSEIQARAPSDPALVVFRSVAQVRPRRQEPQDVRGSPPMGGH